MTISFSGLASGLDTSSWVQSLTALKQAKVTQLQTQREELLLSKNTLQSIRSFFASFRSTIEKITDTRFNIATMDLFAQNLATSANVEKLTATATHEAIEAKYEIAINNLATKTQAVSGNRYKTTIDVTTTATDASLLKNMGVNAGRILVTNPTNGIQATVRIEDNDTLETFIQKLESVGGGGIDANYNSTTGIFTINLDESDIVDLDGTNIKDKLNLVDVSEGYTSDILKIVDLDYTAATGTTKLSALGVNAGTITLDANDSLYNFTIDANTTIDGLINQFAGKNIVATLEDGIFTIKNASIASEGSTNFKSALGFTEEVSSKSQESNALTFQTEVTETTVANRNTKIVNIGSGQTINAGAKLFIKNSNNDESSIDVDENTTIGDLLDAMNSAGLNASIDANGVVQIMGGTISSAGFDVMTVLNLDSDPYSGAVTGNPLNETVEVYEKVTLNTRLVEDLEVKQGFIKVTDENNATRYLEIAAGDTIGTLITKLGKMGIFAELDESTGILTITGGNFEEVADGVITTAAANGHEDLQNPTAPLQASNLITLLYGSSVISASQTQVASTYARSNVLKKAVVNDIIANGDTNMNDLGIAGEVIEIKDTTGTVDTITLAGNMTLDELVNRINLTANVDASLDSEGVLKLTGGYIENATVEKALGLQREITGNSHRLGIQREETIKVFATEDTLFSQIGSGIANGTKLTVHKADGTTEDFEVSATNTDLRSMFNWLATKGVSASISDGVISLSSPNGHYVTGELANELGISTGNVGNNHTFGVAQSSDSVITFTTTNIATTETKLIDIIGSTVWNAMTEADRTIIIKDQGLFDHVNQSYNTPIGTFIVSTTATLGDLLNALSGYGMSVNLDNGIINFDNFNGIYAVDNNDNGVLKKLGISAPDVGDINVTTGILTTSSILTTYTDDITANELSVLKELEGLGITETHTLIVKDANGDANLGTFTTGSKTIGDLLNWLSGYGVLASIDGDGKITIEQGDRYLTGNLAVALGINNAALTSGNATNGTVNTVGTTMTSTVQVLYTGSYAADETTYLTDLGVTVGQTLIIKNANGTDITGGTYTAAATDTVGTLLAWLTERGNTASISNGVITVENGDQYITGNVASTLGIESTAEDDKNVTYKTIGKALTSSEALKYTGTAAATATSLLKDLSGLGITTQTLQVYDSGKNAVDGKTFSADGKTVGELINFLVSNSIAASLTSDGKIKIETSPNYVAGELATKLGIGATTSVVTTTTIGKTMTSSAKLTYVGTGYADANTKLDDLELNGKSLTLYNAGGGAIATFTEGTNGETIGDLLNWLTTNGNTATISNGKITVNNGNFYVAGDIANTLGIAYANTDKSVSTSTTGITQTGSALSYDKQTLADENTKLNQLTTVINDFTLSYAGGTSGSITGIDGNTTIGGLIDKINAVNGLNAAISNGQIIVTTTNNTYITGALATALGIGNGHNEYGENATVGNSYTSSNQIGDSGAITRDTLLSDLGVTDYIVNILDADGYEQYHDTIIDYDSNGVITIGDFIDWWNDDEMNFYSGYDVSINANGKITFTDNGGSPWGEGVTVSGDIIDKLGITFDITTDTSSTSINITSTAKVQYTTTTGGGTDTIEAQSNYSFWMYFYELPDVGSINLSFYVQGQGDFEFYFVTEDTFEEFCQEFNEQYMGIASMSFGVSGGVPRLTMTSSTGNPIGDIKLQYNGATFASFSNSGSTMVYLDLPDRTITTPGTTTTADLASSTKFSALGVSGLNNSNAGNIVIKNSSGSTVNTLLLGTNSSIGDIASSLSSYLTATVSNGKVNISAKSGYIVDISGMNTNLREALKLNGTEAKNISVTTITNNGGESSVTEYGFILDENTTFAQLGIAAGQTISEVPIGGTAVTKTLAADDLNRSIYSYLTSNFSHSSFAISDGKLIATPHSDYYLVFSDGIKTALGFSGDAYREVSEKETVYYNDPSNTLYDNSKKIPTTSTKLSELGFSGNFTIKTSKGDVTGDGTITLQTLFNKLKNDGGIIASISANGEITLAPSNGNNYIYDMDATLAAILGISATDTEYYTSSTSTTWASKTTGTAIIDDGTKQLHTGIKLGNIIGSTLTAGNKTIKTSKGDIVVTKDNTVAELITKFTEKGFTASINTDGKFVISPNDRSTYITDFDDQLAATLKLTDSTSAFYNDATRSTVWTGMTTAARVDAGEKIAIGSVKMSQLGLAEGSYNINTSNGDDIVVTQNTTLDDLVNALNGKLLSASLGADGRLSISSTSDSGTYIEEFNATLASKLKLTVGASNLYTSSTLTVWATETSSQHIDDGTKTIKASTILRDLDADITNQTIVIKSNNNATNVTLTFGATDSMQSIFNSLSAKGIQGAITQDGKVVFTQNSGNYITSISSDLTTALNITNATSNFYVMNTIFYEKTSVAHDWNDPDAYINYAMTLNEIGIGSGTITIWDPYQNENNGGEVTVSYTGTDTLGTVLASLRTNGIEGSIENGRLKLIPENGYYILSDTAATGTAATNTFFKKFNLKIAEDGTYNTESYNDYSNTDSTTLRFSILKTIDSSTTFDDLGLTGGNFTVYNGSDVNISMTRNNTLGDFVYALAGAGISAEIRDGELYIKGSENAYITSMDNAFATRLDLPTDVDDYKNVRQDYTTVNTNSSRLERDEIVKMSDATLLSNLNINSGNIVVYKNGVTETIAIDNTKTMADFRDQLSAYNITSSIVNGQLSLSADGVVWLADDGSNLVQQLGLAYGTWQLGSYSQTSKALGDTEDGTELATTDTKMVDLLDPTGTNNINILNGTEGEYVVYKDGYRSTETINQDTTVGDFITTLGSYGLTANINSQGQIEIGGTGNTYIAKSSAVNAANIENLITHWDFNNIYTSNNLEIPDPISVAITSTTKLKDINNAAGNPGDYTAGIISVVQNGVQTNLSLTADETVGSLMAQLELYGFDCTINDAGQVIVKSDGNSYIKEYSGADRSNALDILGIQESNWIKTNVYGSDTVTVTTTTTSPTAATRDTNLSLLGVSTGEYYIYKDGVRYTALISSDETVGSFLDTLASFGIQGNIVTAANGESSVLEIIGSGDSYIATSNSVNNKSNVVTTLLPAANNGTDFNYTADLSQRIEVITNPEVTLDTLINDTNVAWDDNNVKAAGIIAVTVNGQNFNINVEQNDTFKSLFDKFAAVGIDATLNNGIITLQGGFSQISIDEANTTSDLYDKFNLNFNADMGGFAASSAAVTQTVQQVSEHNDSVSQYADDYTQLSQLNITSGTLSVYKNGQKASIQVKADETFIQLRSRIAAELSGVDIKFEDGYLKFYSIYGDSVEVGSTTDTSNLAAVCGLFNDKSGTVTSARELFKVNGSTKITQANLFSAGDVTEGTFIIGNATIVIDSDTTINGLVSQINASEEANAIAVWDSIDGKFIIESRGTGSSLINIEKGTSNFTDIFGFTVDGEARMDVNAQEIGQNASFSINGTHFTSTSNTVGSDITRLTGVTINLKEITEGETITLTVERDKESVANAMSDIVDAYNELLTNVDEEIARGGTLANQSTLKMIRNQIRTLMTSSISGSNVFQNLDQIGIISEAASGANIDVSNVDTLYFDKDKFLKAFNSDRDAVRNLLIGSGTNTGIFSKVETLLESSLSGAYGYFDSATRNYNSQIQKLDTKIDKAQQAVEKYKLRLEAKFSAMDRLIANMQNQYSSFLG